MESATDSSAEQQERDRRLERDIGAYISEEPLTSLAIAGAAGFILGGGVKSRIGLVVLTIVGKIALRGAATNFIVGLVVPNRTTPERAKSSQSNRDEKYDNARHDNGRTDFRNPG